MWWPRLLTAVAAAYFAFRHTAAAAQRANVSTMRPFCCCNREGRETVEKGFSLAPAVDGLDSLFSRLLISFCCIVMRCAHFSNSSKWGSQQPSAAGLLLILTCFSLTDSISTCLLTLCTVITATGTVHPPTLACSSSNSLFTSIRARLNSSI